MGDGNDQKPRSEWVYARTAGEVDSIHLGVWSDGSAIEFITPVEGTRSRTEYERPKGPKVLNETPISGRKLHVRPVDVLRENYDFLAAVDTNTKQVNGRPVSVSAIVTGIWVQDPKRSGKALQYETPLCVEFSPVCRSPERLGWVIALEELHRLRMLTRAKRIGLIVDSELGTLDQYNSREIPVFENTFLPPEVTLVYASADSLVVGVRSCILLRATSVW